MILPRSIASRASGIILAAWLASAPSLARADTAAAAWPRANAGTASFLIGVNYEGPADRAWNLWTTSGFDPAAIDADLARAQQAGNAAVRLFVQPALRTDVLAGHWDKLDAVLGLADRHHLRVILSLHDDGDRDLARVALVDRAIAARYQGRDTILAYDLKNEPRFGNLALDHYSDPPPLQRTDLIDAYGERVSRDDLADFRASDVGSRSVPASLNDDQAYVYANNLLLYREMLTQAAAWVGAQGGRGTTIDYLGDNAGQDWQPLVQALNDTLAAWLQPQLDAVRSGDPGRPVTLAHVDSVLASLPANDALDYITFHRYPAANAAGVRGLLALVATLEAQHPDHPFVLGEFGFATNKLDPAESALLESGVYLGLVSEHAAGGLKWMLNDLPPGFNMRERTYGSYASDGTPKPTSAAVAALRRYLVSSSAAPGQLTITQSHPGVSLIYQATDALILGGTDVSTTGASLRAAAPTEVIASWTGPAELRIWSSGPAVLTLDPDRLKLGRIGASSRGTAATVHQDPAGRSSITFGAAGEVTLERMAR